MAYDLYHRGNAYALEPGLGNEVGMKESSVAFSPAQGRLVEAHAQGRPWFQVRKDTRIFANLNGLTVVKAGMRMIYPWPVSTQAIENQPHIAVGSYLASAMQVPEGSCAQYGVKKREGDWGLAETCVLPSGNTEVLEDFPWLRAQGFVPVAAIDSNGGFVMGYAWAGDLVQVPPPPFVEGYRETMGPVPGPMPMPVMPRIIPRGLPRIRPRLPRYVPPQVTPTYVPPVVQVTPTYVPPVVLEPDVDATVPAKEESGIWGWLALGGLIVGGLYFGSKAGASRSKSSKSKGEEKTSNRRRRNTGKKRQSGWHWVDKHVAVRIARGMPVEVQTFGGLDLAMAKAIGWWGTALREVGSRSRGRSGPLTIQSVKVEEV